MLSILFEGWAQCRLATDPDPYDEPRGVSGYMQAYVGEPDLDRIIRFSDPAVQRSYTQNIDVRVTGIRLDGASQSNHPLINAKVGLLGDPVFEGRNGVVAEDGLEPIFPFHLQFSTEDHWFSRATVPTDPAQPYREFNASGVKVDPGLIERSTGISSLPAIWRDRLEKLTIDLQSATADTRPGLEERITFLERNLSSEGGASRFFAAYMEWSYRLSSAINQSSDGLQALLPGFNPTTDPWRTTFWFGGWDADAAAYWVNGSLDLGSSADVVDITERQARRPERMTDID